MRTRCTRSLWTLAIICSAEIATANDAESRKSSHPVVAGFERFHTNNASEVSQGGRLLLGELNCVSCHETESKTSQFILNKIAPNLDVVGSRVQPAYLRKFISNPHQTKPGTTMPSLFSGLSPDEVKAKVEPLVHFLAATGTLAESRGDGGAVRRGQDLFHQVGCTACHNARLTDSKRLATSVPLGDPTKKYTLNSFAQFIRDPLKVRPSGRMPQLNLDDKQARDIANYFFKDVKVKPNIHFEYFEGNWQELPDFTKLTPKLRGRTYGFDVLAGKRREQFGMRFRGFVQISVDGEYSFILGSDDGSRLLIDDKQVVSAPGVHPYTQKTGKVKLTKGAHAITVEYFEQGGEERLTVELQGPKLNRQKADAFVTLEAQPPKPSAKDNSVFELDPELVKQGRVLFAKVGCAACHQMKVNNKAIKPEFILRPPSLKDVNAGRGCLAPTVAGNLPNFALSNPQRTAIRAALEVGDAAQRDDNETVVQTMTAFNCFACHQRNKLGGVESDRNAMFITKIKEMGDEGRIPPHLDGIGDKLNSNWLKTVLEKGANDRQYMLARMPRFGMANVGHLVDSFVKLDRKEGEIRKITTSMSRLKSTGRKLVGDRGLSCIKCHDFAKHKATGIQAMSLTTMTKRLREDWFHRYMYNPQDYRPGTRMPSAWPFGRTVIPDVLKGDTHTQIHAVWSYLSDAERAAVPRGIVRSAIELIPDKEPIIYRNFISNSSARGIAVGYPEKANLCFDAENVALALMWQGDFIDASKHWNGRGPGFQSPLGDNPLQLPKLPFAVLENSKSNWPTKSSADLGYKFRGYRLDKQRRPTFRYEIPGAVVEEFLKPVVANEKDEPSFVRTLTLHARSNAQLAAPNWYRAAVGTTITRSDAGWFQVDKLLYVHLETSGAAEPVIRKSKGKAELLLPIGQLGRKLTITQKYVW